MEQQELIPHLFRTEFSKITAVACTFFGIEHIDLAEDIASETFLAALETWTFRGVPANPAAWLYTVAKNKARNQLHRMNLFTTKIAPRLQQEADAAEMDLSEQNIADSQLQMLFAICHPSIPPESQIGLALRILCGFGIDEIASAFLTSPDTISKRLYRAKEKLRNQQVSLAFSHGAATGQRLETVLTTLYLLFNEGYYSESQDHTLREELCLEAMRLAHMLLQNPRTSQPAVKALLALMCFHASRFPARKKANGEMVLYGDQDESLWNQDLIAQGAYFLHQASTGNQLSRYHLEATIAYWHTVKTGSTEKWATILQLYNQLLLLAYSPIAALNRIYALWKVEGSGPAIAEAEKLPLTGNPYYYALLGELYSNLDKEKAKASLEKALQLARTQTDRDAIAKKITNFDRLT
jgi:RNA polymerase sigma-70 factor (ECF subfamily)